MKLTLKNHITNKVTGEITYFNNGEKVKIFEIEILESESFHSMQFIELFSDFLIEILNHFINYSIKNQIREVNKNLNEIDLMFIKLINYDVIDKIKIVLQPRKFHNCFYELELKELIICDNIDYKTTIEINLSDTTFINDIDFWQSFNDFFEEGFENLAYLKEYKKYLYIQL
jgi:hypothetical protein